MEVGPALTTEGDILYISRSTLRIWHFIVYGLVTQDEVPRPVLQVHLDNWTNGLMVELSINKRLC